MAKILMKMIFAFRAHPSRETKMMDLLSLVQVPLAMETLKAVNLLSQITLNVLNKLKNN